jgi:hypothetical protein
MATGTRAHAFSRMGRDPQSMAFFKTPGIE